jgi:hypothetical protein
MKADEFIAAKKAGVGSIGGFVLGLGRMLRGTEAF